MKFNVSPKSAIRCVKFFVDLIVCWPPPLSASKSNLIIRDVLLLTAAFFPVNVLVPLITTIRESRDDVIRVTKTLSVLIAVSFTIFKMIMCRYHRERFQIWFAELDEFINKANSRETAILERYMDRCGPLYTFVGISAVSTCVCFCCGPLVLPQSLPVDAEFPFSIQELPTAIPFLYIIEISVGVQAISAVMVDIEVALLLWFSGIRFELLAEEFMMVASLSDFKRCVEEHQMLLASTGELISTVRYIVLTVIAMSSLGNLCTGYQFVHHQPIAVLAQFFFMLSVMSMEVLMYAWPADNLMALGIPLLLITGFHILSQSENIAYAVYSSHWVGKSPEMFRSIQIVMLRAQKPLVISIGGLLPQLDLDFYGKYLTTSFSYFTTMQAVVE